MRRSAGAGGVLTGNDCYRGMLLWVTYGGVGFQLGRTVEGSTWAVALRVLVDATDVPTDRGTLGRYVDGLIGALGGTGIDLAVACQRADEERAGRLSPH